MKRALWHRIASVVVTILLAFGITSVRAAIPASERAALLHLYTSTNGATWTFSANWNGAAGTECTWYGLTCDPGGNTVTMVNLYSNNLTGSLPSDLNNLTNLTTYNVMGNQLTGSIPALAGLMNLNSFFAHQNKLTGSIPALTNLAKLQFFLVFGNQLTGSIPSLTALTNLVNFNADNNQLTGSIPPLTGLTNLGAFVVSNNQLTGSTPPVTGLTNLEIYWVYSNQLTGSIPTLTSATNLRDFRVSNNHLTGSIPPLTGLTNLQYFDVQLNQLNGSIPALLPTLVSITVNDNQLTGSIPSLTGLTNLQYFNVDNNQLTGNVPSVPSPDGLLAGGSRLCPNTLNRTPDTAWDAATGVTPWYAGCTGALPSPLAGIEYTDVYYNSSEPGWGVFVVQSNAFQFLALFIYGPDGKPVWYTGQITDDGTGNYTGALYASTGTYFASPWQGYNIAAVGTVSFKPTDAYHATLIYTVNGVAPVTKSVQRQTLAPYVLGGNYSGSMSGSVSGCTNPNSNDPAFRGTYNLTVAQVADQSATLAFSFGDTNHNDLMCTLNGPLTHLGRLYQMASAQGSCTGSTINAPNFSATVDGLHPTNQGIEGYLSGNAGGGCMLSWHFGAVKNVNN